ncbi:MAG: hypothetical protein RL417_647 [Pseudomonadota bacterium]|jgi:superfamily II DNA/RNA helicase
MGFVSPTPIQAQSIPAALEGRDLVASAETGSGKTAAFGIPLITRLLAAPESSALILAPTRELAVQIVKVIKDLTQELRRFRAALLIGGVPMGGQLQALRANPRIIVATPGRLVDHLERRSVNLSNCETLVLDEADRMLDMGFAPQLEKIRQVLPTERQTLLFSATMPPDIQALAAKWLRDPVRVAIGQVSKPVDRIEQKVIETDSSAKNDVLLKELEQRSGSILIFTRTKRRTDRLTQVLYGAGHKVVQIHGNRSQNQRQRALDGFREGRYTILVATDIAARGLDIPEIAHVINYDMPMVPEDYVHRIGRTARAGRTGEALALVAPEERSLWKAVVRLMEKGESDTLKSGGHRGRPMRARGEESSRREARPRGNFERRQRRSDRGGATPRGDKRRWDDSRRESARPERSRAERPEAGRSYYEGSRTERRDSVRATQGEGRVQRPRRDEDGPRRESGGQYRGRGGDRPFGGPGRSHRGGPRSGARSRPQRSGESNGNLYIPFESPEVNGNSRAPRTNRGERSGGRPRSFRR